jgi:glucosylceramidase
MDTTSSRRTLAAFVLGAALALTALPGGRADAAVVGTVVSSWVTTPDRTQLLAPGPSQAFRTTGTPPSQVVTVDPTTSYQVFDGVGASITDSSAGLLYTLPQAQRDSVMRSLFSPGEGLGLSLLRQPIGASDFVDEPAYTYDDLPAGSTDFAMARFSIAHDEAQILPLLRQARALNPRLRIIASPWSPPAWMKVTGSLHGGRLKDDPAIFTAYARYLTRFVQAYRDAGVPIYALTVQNEPQYRYPNYPGADMPVAHQVKVIDALGPSDVDGRDRVPLLLG